MEAARARECPTSEEQYAEPLKEREWDNAVTCHVNHASVYTWSLARHARGKHTLPSPDGSHAKVRGVMAAARDAAQNGRWGGANGYGAHLAALPCPGLSFFARFWIVHLDPNNTGGGNEPVRQLRCRGVRVWPD